MSKYGGERGREGAWEGSKVRSGGAEERQENSLGTGVIGLCRGLWVYVVIVYTFSVQRLPGRGRGGEGVWVRVCGVGVMGGDGWISGRGRGREGKGG